MFKLSTCLLPVALLAAQTIGASPAHAGAFVDGNKLYASCMGNSNRDLCYGFLSGVADSMGDQNPVFGFRACLQDGVTMGQLKDVFVLYYYANPANRHFGASSLAADAFERNFPCRQ